MNSPFSRYILSPLATLLTLLAIHLASRYEWFTVSLLLAIGVLALCLFWSGLRANILSAIFISAYALYSPDFDASRTAQLIFTAWPVAIFGGILRRWLVESTIEAEHYRLRLMDTFNGNKAKLVEAIDSLDTLRDGWKTIPNGERLKRVEATRGKLADLVLLVDSYHEMAKDRRLIMEQAGETHQVESND